MLTLKHTHTHIHTHTHTHTVQTGVIYQVMYYKVHFFFISLSDQSIPSLDDILDDESLKHHKKFVEQVKKQVTTHQ